MRRPHGDTQAPSQGYGRSAGFARQLVPLEHSVAGHAGPTSAPGARHRFRRQRSLRGGRHTSQAQIVQSAEGVWHGKPADRSGMVSVAWRPAESASLRLAAVNNPGRLHPQRRIRDGMIPPPGSAPIQHAVRKRPGLTGNNGHSATMPEPSGPAANAGLDGHGAASQPPLTCANANQNAT